MADEVEELESAIARDDRREAMRAQVENEDGMKRTNIVTNRFLHPKETIQEHWRKVSEAKQRAHGGRGIGAIHKKVGLPTGPVAVTAKGESVATVVAGVLSRAEPVRRKSTAEGQEQKRLRKRDVKAARSWSKNNHYLPMLGTNWRVQLALPIRRDLVEQLRKELPSVATQVEVALREQLNPWWWTARCLGGTETASELLRRDSFRTNKRSGQKHILPGVAIPDAVVADMESEDDVSD
jgi:hypothetical protein